METQTQNHTLYKQHYIDNCKSKIWHSILSLPNINNNRAYYFFQNTNLYPYNSSAL